MNNTITIICRSDLKMTSNVLKVRPKTTIAQLSYMIRKRIRALNPDEAVYLFFGDTTLCPMTDTLGQCLKTHGNVDERIIMVCVLLESTFG